MAREHDDEEQAPKKVTDIEAAKWNIENAVDAFVKRWAAMPRFALGVEVMDQRQLRDAMGLRATIDAGDPWPKAEKMLHDRDFHWHWLGGQRVMFVRERDGFIDEDWSNAEELETEDDAVGHCGLDMRIEN